MLKSVDTQEELIVERHPWAPFVPQGAKVLIMGTFPPGQHRWSMDFYYPNRTNDFWRIMGLIFMGDSEALYDKAKRNFRLDRIKDLLADRRIALNDTAREVRRIRGNASDKYLEILKPVPLKELLADMPDCTALATTGEKAAGVIADLTDTAIPRMGKMVTTEIVPEDAAGTRQSSRQIEIWRMPSTSRAYPLALPLKAEYYAAMFRHLGIL